MKIHRQYTLDNHPIRFWTGRRPDGEQILCGPRSSNLLIYSFDADGHLLRREVMPMANPPARDGERSRGSSVPRNFDKLEEVVDGYLAGAGVVAGPIAVGIFFDTEQSVGILDLPSEYSSFLEDPSRAEDEEEAADYEESIANWERTGKFVLIWGTELWMNKKGKLIAS